MFYMKAITRYIAVILAALIAPASQADDESIVDHVNQGTVIVSQPEALKARLLRKVASVEENEAESESLINGAAHKVRAGYRVQIFDDNNVRTAKAQAQSCKLQIETRFPEYAAYVSFNSPYWRVKVGDFKSRSEAEAAMAEIRHAFPSMAKSLRIVRDRINKN